MSGTLSGDVSAYVSGTLSTLTNVSAACPIFHSPTNVSAT